MRAIHKFFIGIALLFSTICAIMLFALTTQTGAKLTLKTVSFFAGDTLSIGKLKGRLIGPLTINNLKVSRNDNTVTVEHLELDWRPLELINKKLDITKLDAINLKVSQKKLEWIELSKLNGQGELTNTDISVNLNFLGNVYQKKLTGKILIDHSTSTLHELDVLVNLHAGKASLQANGTLKKAWNIKFNFSIPSLTELYENYTGKIDLNGRITGNHNNPRLDAKLLAKNLVTPQLTVSELIASISGTANQHQINLSATQNLRTLKMHINGQLQPGKWTGNITKLKLPQFAIRSKTKRLTVKSGTIIIQSIKNSIQSQLQIIFAHHTPLNANLTYKKERIKGELTWQTKDMTWLPYFAESLKNTHGALDIALKASGTFEAPHLSGIIKLSDASTEIPSVNANIKDITATIKGDGSSLSYQAHASAGKGWLKVTGKTVLDRPGMPTVIHLTGDNALISNYVEYQIWISPKINLIANNRTINISGSIHIPRAHIQPIDFNNTVNLPPEVVFINGKLSKQEEEKEKEEKWKIYSNIDLTLGDKVEFIVLGLNGSLRGKLALHDEPGRTTSATGQLVVKNGSFNAYNRKLTVSNGILNFMGGPVTNPTINAQATRTFKGTGETGTLDFQASSLTVGVNIQGPLRDPHTTLFSSPAGLSQANILSYLVLGQPTNQASSNKAATLLQAASALNVGGDSGSSHISNQIKQSFGLSNFGIETQTTVNSDHSEAFSNTSLVLGKYLSPKLYIKYSMGLLEQVNTFTMHYQLNKRWSIETSSSTAGNGVDLLYNISH